MSTHSSTDRTYTIMEAARLSGLSESTLRYYETIGIIEPIARDASSKHRTYSEDNINTIIAVSCLSATGMSIEAMRSYLANRADGAQAAAAQINLLKSQQKRLTSKAELLIVRQRYVDIKIDYWEAVKAEDAPRVAAAKQEADTLAAQLKVSHKT